ncbi:MAG: hypothetical protein ACNYPE_12595 [Candidatus Azotimanducaceae bacterium WSBS_2022_MAG_OTU7]
MLSRYAKICFNGLDQDRQNLSINKIEGIDDDQNAKRASGYVLTN